MCNTCMLYIHICMSFPSSQLFCPCPVLCNHIRLKVVCFCRLIWSGSVEMSFIQTITHLYQDSTCGESGTNALIPTNIEHVTQGTFVNWAKKQITGLPNCLIFLLDLEMFQRKSILVVEDKDGYLLVFEEINN